VTDETRVTDESTTTGSDEPRVTPQTGGGSQPTLPSAAELGAAFRSEPDLTDDKASSGLEPALDDGRPAASRTPGDDESPAVGENVSDESEQIERTLEEHLDDLGESPWSDFEP
jgi:hypothetical protein